jgi:hypothetical protein
MARSLHKNNPTFMRQRMHTRYLPALLALALALSGCSGNYTWSDDQYRPLGEPQAAQRGK